jgi:type IV fimbrial biogenesis protein FimT
MLTHRRHAGFTLMELLVALAVLIASVTLAAPGFSQSIANYKVRVTSEGILGGLNYARTEALRRNSAVTFALAPGGSGWTVSQDSPNVTLQSRSDSDSPIVTSSTAATSVTFLATGLLQTGSQLSQVTVSSSVPNTETRRIDIFGGGLIRLCDPTVKTANDPRRC